MTTTYSERPKWSFTTWRNSHSFEANINNAIPVYVYSASTDAVRVVNIPKYKLGGFGIFGCDVGHGYLRLPTRRPSTSGNVPTSSDENVANEGKLVIGVE